MAAQPASVSRSMLVGLVLHVMAVGGFAAALVVARVSSLGDTLLVLLFTAVPAIGNALAGWGVSHHRAHAPGGVRVVQVAFALAALLLANAGLSFWYGANDPGLIAFVLGVLAQMVAWMLVPWLGPRWRYRAHVAVVLGVITVVLFLGVPAAAIIRVLETLHRTDGWLLFVVAFEGVTVVLGVCLLAGVWTLLRSTREASTDG